MSSVASMYLARPTRVAVKINRTERTSGAKKRTKRSKRRVVSTQERDANAGLRFVDKLTLQGYFGWCDIATFQFEELTDGAQLFVLKMFWRLQQTQPSDIDFRALVGKTSKLTSSKSTAFLLDHFPQLVSKDVVMTILAAGIGNVDKVFLKNMTKRPAVAKHVDQEIVFNCMVVPAVERGLVGLLQWIKTEFVVDEFTTGQLHTLLSKAACEGHPVAVRTLADELAQTTDLSKIGSKKQNDLMICALRSQNLEVIQTMLKVTGSAFDIASNPDWDVFVNLATCAVISTSNDAMLKFAVQTLGLPLETPRSSLLASVVKQDRTSAVRWLLEEAKANPVANNFVAFKSAGKYSATNVLPSLLAALPPGDPTLLHKALFACAHHAVAAKQAAFYQWLLDHTPFDPFALRCAGFASVGSLGSVVLLEMLMDHSKIKQRKMQEKLKGLKGCIVAAKHKKKEATESRARSFYVKLSCSTISSNRRPK